VNRSAVVIGSVFLVCGGGLGVIGIRGLISGEPARGGDLAAGIVLSLLLLVMGIALACFLSGLEVDDHGRRIVRWTRWRGFRRREVSTSFDSVTELRLYHTPGAKYSPPVWRIMAELKDGPAIEFGRRIDADLALEEGRRMAARIGAPFPQGLTEWSGRQGAVNCTVSLGTNGLTVGEFTDDPHQLNDTMTITLTEYASSAPHGRANTAREIIRNRLGAAVAAEIDEAVRLRSFSRHSR
jgi:hypothetical protein